MIISVGKLKKLKVYLEDKAEPLGVVFDTVLDKEGRVVGYIVKTISLIPLSKIIKLCDIAKINDDGLILYKNTVIENLEHFKNRTGELLFGLDGIKTNLSKDKKPRRIRDAMFDMETGEICDVVVLKNIIKGKEKISVNKISAKDNTIYIEK